MSEYISKLSANDLGMLLFVGGCTIFALVVTIASLVYSFRKAELNSKLKHDMLDRGMSAEEIKIVLEAGPK